MRIGYRKAYGFTFYSGSNTSTSNRERTTYGDIEAIDRFVRTFCFNVTGSDVGFAKQVVIAVAKFLFRCIYINASFLLKIFPNGNAYAKK